MSTNRLDEIMVREALSNAQLARLASLSDKTIAKVRRRKSNPSANTINAIVKGLNLNPHKLCEYTRDDVFGNNVKSK